MSFLRRIAMGLALAVWAVPQARAQPADPPPAATDAGPAITWRLNVEWITAARGLSPHSTPVDPENTLLRLPQWWSQSEVRPNLRVEFGPRWQIVARPRAIATWSGTWADGRPRDDATEASANWTELFVAWRPHDAVAITYGLQNFQWGPAELVSPSNRLFHEVGVLRDPLYYVRGRHLLRVNLSSGRQWSLVTLAELGANGEPPFEAGNQFRRQGQAKLEWTDAAGSGYIGVTAGVREASSPWFGGYGSLPVTEGLSIYADVNASSGSRAWYPVATEAGAIFLQSRAVGGATRWYALGGARYTFVNGVDARLEYLNQDAGYTRGQLRLAQDALATARDARAAEPYFAPGLEFLGRRLVMVSVRAPDLPPGKTLEIQGRYLHSITDKSGVMFVTASAGAADRVTLFMSAALTHGTWYGELSRLADAAVTGGLVWNW